MWSESPVVYPRERVAGAGEPPQGLLYVEDSPSATLVSITWGADPKVTLADGTAVEGRTIVACLFWNEAFTSDVPLSGGWATLSTGAVGGVGYRIAWAHAAPTLPMVLTFASDPHVTGRVFQFTGAGALTPFISAGPVESVGVTSIGFPATAGALPWQAVGSLGGLPFSFDWETNGVDRRSGTLDSGTEKLAHFCSTPGNPFPVPGSPPTFYSNWYGGAFTAVAFALAWGVTT
jgi:hypothetical protein